MFDEEATKQALLEATPICPDAMNIIIDMARPRTFQVGDIIADRFGDIDYKIIKRNAKSVRVLETTSMITFPCDSTRITESGHRIVIQEVRNGVIHFYSILKENYVIFKKGLMYCVSEIETKASNRRFKIDKDGDEYIPCGNKKKDRIKPYHTFKGEMIHVPTSWE